MACSEVDGGLGMSGNVSISARIPHPTSLCSATFPPGEGIGAQSKTAPGEGIGAQSNTAPGEGIGAQSNTAPGEGI